MEIGKLEAVFTSDPVAIERARLQRKVVEAALRLRRSALTLKKFWDEHDENAPHAAMEIYELSGEDVAAREAFDRTTDALIEFESTHGIETKD